MKDLDSVSLHEHLFRGLWLQQERCKPTGDDEDWGKYESIGMAGPSGSAVLVKGADR